MSHSDGAGAIGQLRRNFSAAPSAHRRCRPQADGIGTSRTRGNGILGMQERARLNDGDLEITSEAGAGTTVTLDFACTERPVIP